MIINYAALLSMSACVAFVMMTESWWIRNWSHIATHLVVLFVVIFVLLGATCSKKPKASSFQVG